MASFVFGSMLTENANSYSAKSFSSPDPHQNAPLRCKRGIPSDGRSQAPKDYTYPTNLRWAHVSPSM